MLSRWFTVAAPSSVSFFVLLLYWFLCSLSPAFFFFFNDPAPPEIYTLSLHDALPIFLPPRRVAGGGGAGGARARRPARGRAGHPLGAQGGLHRRRFRPARRPSRRPGDPRGQIGRAHV